MNGRLILAVALFILSSCAVSSDSGDAKHPDYVTSKEPQLFAEGTISTGEYETHPAFSPSGDTVYFLKCLPDANFYSICVSYFKEEKWSAPEIVSFSGQYVDADPFVTKDGNSIYFVSNRPVAKGEKVKDDWDIWRTDRTAFGWSNPVHLDSPINSSGSEYFPTIADNGNFYFGSSRKGGKGGADIYMARMTDNGYAIPENLGDSINTGFNEYEPYISPDEQFIIFMATQPDGLANADFYTSRRENGIWSRAKKLPAPINSDFMEWGGKFSADGKFFFFGSNRSLITTQLPNREDMQQFTKRLHAPGNGLGDIYYVSVEALR